MSYALNRQQFGWVPHPSPLHCRLTPHVKPKNWELWVLPLILGRYGTNNLKYSKPPRLVFCQILTSRMLKSGANWRQSNMSSKIIVLKALWAFYIIISSLFSLWPKFQMKITIGSGFISRFLGG